LKKKKKTLYVNMISNVRFGSYWWPCSWKRKH